MPAAARSVRSAALAALCGVLVTAGHAGEAPDGHADYLRHCAACHGERGAGDGPAAAALTLEPGPLTGLAAANGGSFPETFVYRIIDGREMVSGHGSRDMPIWGNRFAAAGDSPLAVERRIDALIRHLESLQRPASGAAR